MRSLTRHELIELFENEHMIAKPHLKTARKSSFFESPSEDVIHEETVGVKSPATLNIGVKRSSTTGRLLEIDIAVVEEKRPRYTVLFEEVLNAIIYSSTK